MEEPGAQQQASSAASSAGRQGQEGWLEGLHRRLGGWSPPFYTLNPCSLCIHHGLHSHG